jgi:type I restriction-modification system DNA methylase subunit
LLLKVGDEAGTPVTLYGQEKDAATSGLARMNMILHNNPTALITQGNTLTDPKYKVGEALKTFDYVVANPPFSDKRWSTGLDPLHDPYDRFQSFGVPPAKQGDYAYLLHIVRSLKSTGKGACILPHGVLFRGNAEAGIRRALVRKGYIKGIIGLPANLFYGTGIPACIVVIDKEDAQARKGIFMIDASRGFMKDGPKNRLRAQDIHKIVDVFNKQLEVEKYSRLVSFEEIERNEFNLNLPRYIDSQEPKTSRTSPGTCRRHPRRGYRRTAEVLGCCPNLKSLFSSPCGRGWGSGRAIQPRHRQVSIKQPSIPSRILRLHRGYEPAFRQLADEDSRFPSWTGGGFPSEGIDFRPSRRPAQALH